MLTVAILEMFIKYTQFIFEVSRTVVGGFCLLVPAEAGEMAHRLRALVALVKDLDLVSSTTWISSVSHLFFIF